MSLLASASAAGAVEREYILRCERRMTDAVVAEVIEQGYRIVLRGADGDNVVVVGPAAMETLREVKGVLGVEYNGRVGPAAED